MNSSAPAAPPGWYPGPDGIQRYWDGEQWLEMPPPSENADGVEADDEVRADENNETPSEGVPAKGNKRAVSWVAYAAAAVVIVGLVVGGIVWKSSSDAQQAAAAAAQLKAQEEKAKEEEAAKAAQQEKEAQEAADERERETRRDMVTEVEKSIKTMAKKHVKAGLLDGPIISVGCDPVSGGSVDDLSDRTTVFQCFVANKDNKDGTLSGTYYHATVNWETQEYTYGYGEP